MGKICRRCSLAGVFLLFFQVSFAQNPFGEADLWLQSHLQILGGRVELVVFKNGSLVFDRSYNNLSNGQRMAIRYFARRQHKDPQAALADFTLTTREPIASCSKWLTAALVMTFVDKGELRLQDTIGKFLPVFTRHHKGNITIADCLSHQTGIKGGSLRESRQLITQSHSMAETMEKIASLPLEGPPGSTFHYGSIGPEIAAAVIEKVSGNDFRTLFEERIARPCHMTETDFGQGEVPLAAGGAVSTPEDYLNFLTMILQKGSFGGKQILSKSSIQAMETNLIQGSHIVYSPVQSVPWGYGLGEWTLDSHQPQADAVSSPGLFGAFPWVDNKRHYAAFLFVVNLHNKDREQNYTQLKTIIDRAMDQL